MTSTERVWLTPRAHDRLQAELAALLTPATRTAATGADSAVDSAADNAVDNAVDDARRRAARVRVLQELLACAVVGEDPPNDGVAEPGMVLTVRYDDNADDNADDTADEETFLLGLRDAEQPGHDDRDGIEVYSPTSPLGMAVTGARPGDQRSYRVPSGTTVRVTLLDAVPYGRHHTVSVTPTGPA
jgi:transcription elongation GreA/GreB family factor